MVITDPPERERMDAATARSPVVEPTKPRLLDVLGPGLITGASDDDPSGISTYSQAGAQFGYATDWTLFFTLPLMIAVQIISARVGRTTGLGIAGNFELIFPAWSVRAVVAAVLVANLCNIGADLGAMAEGLKLVVGGPATLYVIGFGLGCLLLQVFMRYKRYVGVLKWLTLVLFAYVATLFTIHIDWGALALGLFVPRLQTNAAYWTVIVAIFGTTISPYLFFWQSSQEVEDLREKPEEEPLLLAPKQAPAAYTRITLDTAAGMAISNVIALTIMVTTAATLHAGGHTDIETASQAAEALRPLAGPLAGTLFALGIVGTGLLAIPVLGGSAAYALSEALNWPTGLGRNLGQAKAFYATLAVAVVVGIALNFVGIPPIKALFWSAVVNGVVAAPIMAMLMVLSTSTAIMGDFVIGRALRLFGWAGTVAMGVATVGMFATMALA
jgi:Mn2+/Fe2+ NRAMP family transporter